MYSYYYPNYYNPAKTGTPVGGAGTQENLPPIPGTTSGPPSTYASPPPPTMQPPPVDFEQEPGPPVTTDIGYTQAYLKTQIGKRVRVEFLIGTGMMTDRTGILTDVGISYIIIKPVGTDDRMLCDIYSIKFITFMA